MTLPRNLHDCPGGCGKQVPRHKLSCRADWYRLPAELRRAITDAFHRGTPAEHRQELARALAWYRDNPAGAR